MILLCNIDDNMQSLKLAFCAKDIKLGNDFYSAQYHREYPYFSMHNNSNHEYIILNIKPMTDIFFQNGHVTLFSYDGAHMQHFLQTYIQDIIADAEGIKIICHSQKSHFKRRIGRIYSDIL